MRLVYDSLTGNVRRFTRGVQQEFLNRYGLELPLLEVQRGAPGGDYLLLTYTFGEGEVPRSTARFLAEHSAGLRAVVASGSFHWGPNFGRAGDIIAHHYSVPFLVRLNKAGNQKDKETVIVWLARELASQHQRTQ